MADILGTQGHQSVVSDVQAVLDGGEAFEERLRQLSLAKDQANAAFAELKLGKDAKGALREAQRLSQQATAEVLALRQQADKEASALKAQARETLDDARKQAAAIIADANSKAKVTTEAAAKEAADVAAAAAAVKIDADVKLRNAEAARAEARTTLSHISERESALKQAHAAATTAGQDADTKGKVLQGKLDRLQAVLRELT